MSKKLPELYYTEHYCDIPNEFYSAGTGEKFVSCTICGKELLESNMPYIIEKIIKNYPKNNTNDTIAEYALCIECVEKTREGFSEESLQKINNYILNKTDLVLRRNQFIEKEQFDVKNWLSNCIINNKNQNQLEEYQIMCQCQGNKMLFTFMPYMLSCDAADEMQELLSKKTKDELDRFYRNNLDIPPELRALFKTKVPIL